MRIVWKDTTSRNTTTYKGVTTHKVEDGWKIDIPGDDTVYKSRYKVRIAIEKYLDSKQNSAS